MTEASTLETGTVPKISQGETRQEEFTEDVVKPQLSSWTVSPFLDSAIAKTNCRADQEYRGWAYPFLY